MTRTTLKEVMEEAAEAEMAEEGVDEQLVEEDEVARDRQMVVQVH
jgi:hypothetical protein